MPRSICAGLAFLLLLAPLAFAQSVVGSNQEVAADTPEAWAMRYFAGTTLMTSFGATAPLALWQWNVALDLGSIPRLSDAQQRVGFGGFKREDLNKSPVFGRARVALGLSDAWVVELGYTPPLEIAGSRARNVVALAVGRPLVQGEATTLSTRALGQIGKVEGDITCSARLAGVPDRGQNPYGCQAPSRDVFTADYVGIDATLGHETARWKWHASAGAVRTRLAVQVDALVLAANDRSRLASNNSLAWFTVGARYDPAPHWSIGAEVLYVPLAVRRPPDFTVERDPLSSFRLQLRFSTD